MTVSHDIVPSDAGSAPKQPQKAAEMPSPAEACGLSRITFSYGLPMMRVGAHRPLVEADLPAIRRRDQTELVVERTIEAWQAEVARRPSNPSMLRAIVRLYRGKLVISGMWCLAESVVRIAQPLLLKEFLRSLTTGDVPALYSYAAALVLASLIQAVIHHQLFFETMTTGWNLRIGVSGTLHWKLLRLRAHTISSGSVDCYNLVSNDCQRFDMASPAIHFGWTVVVDIVAVTILLILEVGWLATVCSVSVALLITAAMTRLGTFFSRRRQITAGITDERLKLTSETLSAIMSVKVYCWERAFMDRISRIREREHASIFKRQTMVSASNTMYFALTPLSCLVLFLVFVGQGKQLDLPLVYTALSLIMVLRLGVGKSFGFFITTVPELITAISRFTVFLSQPEVSLVNSSQSRLEAGAPVLEVNGASFSWPSGARVLNNLNVCLRQGELLVVTGPVGCGKSAFLQALLGDLDLGGGSYELKGSVGYAQQTPWIMAGTLRSNILVGGEKGGTEWYDEVISACCLREDISQLDDGDSTEIGERGVNLSGGQRARVGLARAVHAMPDIALLDDPLAAVDPAVATHLVRQCLRGSVLKSAAVVLCTHQESVFALADTLILLDEGGNVRGCGPPREVAEACGFTLAEPIVLDEESAAQPAHTSQAGDAGHDAAAAVKNPLRSTVGGAALVKKEDTRTGSVGWRTYAHFARLAGFGLTSLVFLLFLVSQCTLLATNYWIGVWAQAEDQGDSFYTVVFVCLTAVTIVSACSRTLLFYYTSMKASSAMHGNALKSLIHTHLGFFTANPQGRILNRFSGDLGNVDELLSQAMHEVFDLGFIGFSTVIVVSIAVPPMIPAFALIFLYMFRLRQFVVKSMTQLKRMDSTSRSPVLDCFNASLKGVTSIRAFGRQEVCQQRMVGFLQRNAQAWFWWLITNRFIGMRLDMQSAVIMGIATFGGALLRDIASQELIALAVVNTISLSGLFQYMVRQTAMVESFMTSFERLQAYSQLESEPTSGTLTPEAGFPQKGSIEVSSLQMRYREDLPEVLRGVTFQCKGGLKVGICGRTGSGKSSLFMALARLGDNTAGSINIDGLNAAQLPLDVLRRCIAWVPQEPNFFSGSLRLNLDPYCVYSDNELRAALHSVEMMDAVGPQGLESAVAEGGSNFSIGERQLLSLARALLQRRKIVCMDEAFANVDFATDAKVQAAIRAVADSTGATVLVVAHRMQTLADSDYLVVMGDGHVVEHGRPEDLLAKGGVYATMISHTQSSEGMAVEAKEPLDPDNDLAQI